MFEHITSKTKADLFEINKYNSMDYINKVLFIEMLVETSRKDSKDEDLFIRGEKLLQYCKYCTKCLKYERYCSYNSELFNEPQV